jgi:alpha-mannosidase
MRALPIPFWLLVAFHAVAQVNEVPPKVSDVRNRLEKLVSLPLSDWRVAPALAHGERTDLDDSKWQRSAAGQKLPFRGWFRQTLTMPATSAAGYPLTGARVWLNFKADGIGAVPLTIFVNGLERYQCFDAGGAEPVLLTEHAKPGEKFVIAARTTLGRRDPMPVAETWLISANLEFEFDSLSQVRVSPGLLAQELGSTEALLELDPADKTPRDVFEKAVSRIDWRALSRRDLRTFDASLTGAHDTLSVLRPWLKGHSIKAIGHSHIDMAWLWPSSETTNVVYNTLATALQLMSEYPTFTYAQSSAQVYEWLEDKYPALFDEIRMRVAEGRWEVVGGTWVECDFNLPDGESLARQLLYGKRFFKDKLGVDVTVGWNPDSFGFTWQLPQLLRSAGIDSFVTQKLDWNDTTRFPHRLFWWESPDGSRVLTYFPQKYDNPIDPTVMAHQLATQSAATGLPSMLHLYGVGDHGGGPTRRMLDLKQQWSAVDSTYPTLESTTARAFFDEILKTPKLAIPTWRDELYLEYHRGVYTSQSETKKGNRRTEDLLAAAETFSTLASLKGLPYPTQALHDAYKKLLFNQFHDILPGSGIGTLYRDAARDYGDAGRVASEALQRALLFLAGQVDTTGTGMPVVVFNGLGWPRSDVVEVELQFAQPVAELEVKDALGRTMPAQFERGLGCCTAKVRFVAESVPGIGYKLFRISSVQHAQATATTLVANNQARGIENEFLRLNVDEKTGCVSLFDKRAQREVFKNACGNVLQAFTDKPAAFDAWNIDENFEAARLEVPAPSEVKVLPLEATRVALRVTTRFRESVIEQEFVLTPKSLRVDVETRIDWQERHTLIKVAFPLEGQDENATFEVPFGAIARSTSRTTASERAKFEVPALRWADLSGFALLNDSKHGYDAKNAVIRLTLLRAPTEPDPAADRGVHQFVYALYPHQKDWKTGAVMRQGYELNRKLLPVVTTVHGGSLEPAKALLRVSPENLAIAAVKKAEDASSAVIVRFFEFEGQSSEAVLELPFTPARASSTTLLEEPVSELKTRGREVLVPTGHHAIKTVRLEQ